MVCEHTLFSPGDEGNFTHRPGILHLHKSVTVHGFCVVFRDAHRHTEHTLCCTTSQPSSDNTKAGNQTYKRASQLHSACFFKMAFWKQQNYTKRWLTACSPEPPSSPPPFLCSAPCLPPSPSLSVCVCPLCSCVLRQSIFSISLNLDLELRAIFTQTLQKGAINNWESETCYVIQNVV